LIIGTSVIILLAVLLVRNHIKSEEKKAYGPKSGLLNEDYFFHDMQAILFHDDSPFGLVAMNIKGFKNINSTYGADIADELLVTIGKAVNDYFKDKEDDIAGYQRGDNYMLLLKGNEDDVLYKLTTLDY
jgi:GGDEF domain-containing protein